jgi:hypothetical protein
MGTMIVFLVFRSMIRSRRISFPLINSPPSPCQHFSLVAGMDQERYQYGLKKRYDAINDGVGSFTDVSTRELMPGAGASLAPVKTFTGEKTLTLHGDHIGARMYIKQWKIGAGGVR